MTTTNAAQAELVARWAAPGASKIGGRIASRIALNEAGCWVADFTKNHSGYPMIKIAGRLHRVHRVAYGLSNGEVPSGLVLDHLCRNRACCNPQHLEPVSIGENVMRGDTIPARHRAKNECPAGHAYDVTEKAGNRRCSRCRRAQAASRRAQSIQMGA
jgi:hypothetical protein